MRQRVVTGVLGGAFIAFVTYYGGILYDFVYFGITCIAIYELSKTLFNSGFKYGAIINYLFAISLFVAKINDYLIYFNFILFLYISFNFVMFIFNKKINLKIMSQIIFVGSYVVFFMYHMILMNNSKFVWIVYIIAFGSDTFAYFTGKLFGRHKLYPQVSPNKTIEGAIGGILGCTIISLFYFDYLRINKYIYIIIFSVSASVFSMLGDLAASKIKREYKIKDFGNFLPGHGGILDRFDSVLFVAPVVYYFINHFI
ncbi:phosphatidate cytidylyltransferase [Sedimentibacter sp. MB31-C6]|uniref:phosphatidate cytidylyltransferase n=1 Tax=Sedimentibacter sp. MB31-C6 TaxID=3109366 RepID=UPI002DDD737C|nr:phosphatidate cytidylyltransferase [Sedimentibacter sp. MB36-C1]WSI04275.1 phosphatidate cytidylyltransferase [Sedimentibacter sp. MB36-C1]